MCELRLHYAADLECEWLRNSFWSTDDGISHHGQMGLRALIILVYRKFGIEVLKDVGLQILYRARCVSAFSRPIYNVK